MVIVRMLNFHLVLWRPRCRIIETSVIVNNSTRFLCPSRRVLVLTIKDSDDGVCCTELLGLLWTLFIVLYVEDKKYHNVSETGSVSVLRWMGQDKPTQLGPLERASLNHWTKTSPIALYNIHHRQNPYKIIVSPCFLLVGFLHRSLVWRPELQTEESYYYHKKEINASFHILQNSSITCIFPFNTI
jgi:hypothetical protein